MSVAITWSCLTIRVDVSDPGTENERGYNLVMLLINNDTC